MNKFLVLTQKFLLLLVILESCNGLDNYKVGNRVTLDYPIETHIRFNILKKYIDQMASSEYKVPEKWKGYTKLIDIDSIDTRRIYFAKDPEEMYLIQFNGVLLLADVMNENIAKGGWVANRKSITRIEEERIKTRFKVEILDRVEIMAKKDNLADSLIFFKSFQ